MSKTVLAFGRRWLRRSLFIGALAISCDLAGAVSHAQDVRYVQRIVVPVNKSVTMDLPTPFSSAVVGSPTIADALPITNRTLVIQAKKIGTTNVSIFDEQSHLIKVVDVDVTLDTGELQSQIRAVTRSRGIRVRTNGSQVMLTGTAVSASEAEQAVNLAKAWSQNANVINAMQIATPQQVMLKVRFLNVSRTAGRELGVNNFVTSGGGTRGVNTGVGGLTSNSPQQCVGSVCPPVGNSIFQTAGTLVSAAGVVGQPFGTVLAQIVNNGVKIDTLITALENKGLLQTLAEPNLVALSGQTASFQAGGQIPVPIAVTSGIGIATPTIEYKDFGVLLRFRPTVLSDGIIDLSINPEVSELDFNNAVMISGTQIPALTRRTATTTVELRDGQSFAIAGLLQTENDRTIAQLPWVGSVPVLGTLFRSSSYQKNESDLVIIVTPRFVVPARPGARLATPFDNTVPSNDVDFFLLGEMERRKQYTDYVSHGGKVKGPYGDMIGVAVDQAPLGIAK